MESKPELSILERAKQRHDARTPEQIEGIKKRAWTREMSRRAPHYSEAERKALAEHWIDVEKELGIKKGRMMSIEEADKQSANPNYLKGHEYEINCQTCSPAYVLREWGFDVKAKGNTAGSLSEYLSRQKSFTAWKNIDGTDVKPIFQREWLDSKNYKRMTEKRWKEYFNEACKEDGTYLLTIGWKGGGGHATILKKTKDGLFYIEPQLYNKRVGAKRPISELCKDGAQQPISTRGILRVDNKLFVSKYLEIFDK